MNQAAEYQMHDRIRTLVNNGEIPQGTKGNIAFVGKSSISVRANINGKQITEYFTPDQVEPVISVTAGTGEIERTRALWNAKYVGTNLPEELMEVQQHIREMIEVGHTYLYMERYLMSMGYGHNVIRKSFKQLTGIAAEDAVNFNYQYSPGSIPGFSLGWGEAKKGKGYYFIMPGVNWYSIMHQQDDMTRIEVEKCYTLPDAIDNAKKLVKHLERWDTPVNELKLDKEHQKGLKDGSVKMDVTQLYRQPQLFMQAKEVGDLLKTLGSRNKRESFVNRAYLDGKVNLAERNELLAVFCDAEEDTQSAAAMEKLEDAERDQMKKPLKDELSEKTPAQFFEKKKLERRYSTLPADVVSSVTEYIDRANNRLKDFNLNLVSFKYCSIQPMGTQSMPGDEPDVMNTIASVSVLLEIFDKKSSETNNKKWGLLVFSVIKSSIYTTDTIKGEDDWVYGMSDDGLSRYFQAERELAVVQK